MYGHARGLLTRLRRRVARMLHEGGQRQLQHHRWRRAAASYRIATTLDPRSAKYHRRLSRARAKLGDWEGSADASLRAIACRGTALDQYRLGTARRNLGDWRGARAAYQQAVELDPVEVRFTYWLGRAHAYVGDWTGAEAAYRLGVENGQDRLLELSYGLAHARLKLNDLDGARDALKAARAALDAERPATPEATAHWLVQLSTLHLRVGETETARELFGRALDLDDDEASRLERLGIFLQTMKDWSRAIDAFERALELVPAEARLHYRLGRALEGAAREAEQMSANVGIVRPVEDTWRASANAYLAALQLDPDHAASLYRLAQVRSKMDEPAEAIDLLERAIALDSSRPEWHFRLGVAIAAVGHQRGALRPDELEGATRSFRRALQLAPTHERARTQLTRIEIRRANWPAASVAAWQPTVGEAAPTVLSDSEIRQLRAALEQPEEGFASEPLAEILQRPACDLREVPIGWWFPLHWRLLSMKYFSLAYRAKEILAERIVEEGVDTLEGPFGSQLEAVRSYVFLGQFEHAHAHLSALQRRASTETERLITQKFHADLAVAQSDIDRHVEMLALYRRANHTEAEGKFRELIEGARVAVVGPADAELIQGKEIDDFDVVIRTKFVPSGLEGHEETAGTRTDLSYYAVASTALLSEEIREALRDGHLQMAVFRTSRYRQDMTHLQAPGDLRFVPSEYRLSLLASQFAIQRIIYDVLRYRPQTVKVFNINFFASRQEYRGGYRLGPTRSFASQGLSRPLSAFGHDFRADFALTRRWARDGLIEVDPVVEDLLTLSPTEYLAVMDEKRGAGTASKPGVPRG